MFSLHPAVMAAALLTLDICATDVRPLCYILTPSPQGAFHICLAFSDLTD